jgi:prepilin-type N-terminal cleavage/methylation domain-containing protein/prepilin-type processing-associated H-X9-DG protein
MNNASHNLRPPQRRAFTLIELLVVIGIISVLISILLPVIGRAREQARGVQCMSNLRQLRVAALLYSHDNKGILLPMGYTTGVNDNVNLWPVILVSGRYLPKSDLTDPNDGRVAYKSAFFCPSARFDQPALGLDLYPTSTTDPTAARAFRSVSVAPLEPGLIVDCTYGQNATTGSFDVVKLPVRRYPGNLPNNQYTDTRMTKLTQIKRPSEMAWMFDGQYGNLMNNVFRLNGRHDNRRSTNVLMFDGSAHKFERKALPDDKMVFQQASSDQLTLKWPQPKWRMDQR